MVLRQLRRPDFVGRREMRMEKVCLCWWTHRLRDGGDGCAVWERWRTLAVLCGLFGCVVFWCCCFSFLCVVSLSLLGVVKHRSPFVSSMFSAYLSIRADSFRQRGGLASKPTVLSARFAVDESHAPNLSLRTNQLAIRRDSSRDTVA